jgi:hypothetical protein
MTPRSLFLSVPKGQLDQASKLAEENGFTAIPIVDGGVVSCYWSQPASRELPITRRLKVTHDLPLMAALPRLMAAATHFVYYDRELIGLINLSDLNKPLGRLPWLHLLLDVEQRILEASIHLSQDSVEIALGKAAGRTKKRQANARANDVHLSLLSFAQFSDALQAAIRLNLIDMSIEGAARMTKMRNRLAHGTLKPIEGPMDGKELDWVRATCRRITDQLIKRLPVREGR